MTTPFRTPAVVEIEWVDSMAYPGWRDGNDLVQRTECVDDMRHRTCGYLVKKTQQYVAIGLSIGWFEHRLDGERRRRGPDSPRGRALHHCSARADLPWA